MSFIAPGDFELQQNAPLDQLTSLFAPQEGGHFLYSYTTPSLFSLSGTQSLAVFATDLFQPSRLDLGFLRFIRDQIAGVVSSFGGELLMYTVFESAILNLSIPSQICISIAGTDPVCFEPPFRGQTLVTAYQYRIYLVMRDRPAGAMAVRAALPVFISAALWAALALILIVVGLAAFKGIWSGEITFPSIADKVHELGLIPGENFSTALQPLANTAIVISGIGFLGIATAAWLAYKSNQPIPQPQQGQFTGTVGVGAGPVRVGGTYATAGAARSAPRRRR